MPRELAAVMVAYAPQRKVHGASLVVASPPKVESSEGVRAFSRIQRYRMLTDGR